ncbi:hypothetical protein C7391_0361 [Methanimicrococcus blatticola]|uniref:Uncharacterized protein n=2 Tax=Methanimicrococcus blatticola TaxID=91560 RepID=A0A484F809_9EURY|nr:hypothetical protein C7391_0361 [Methanimicrococcus blatticola]
MKNPLQEIFNEEEPTYKGTLRFNDTENSKEFQNLLKNLTEDEVEIKGVKNIETYIETKSGKYLLDITTGNMAKILISLPYDVVSFEIETDYEKYTFNFKRYFTKNRIVLNANVNSFIDIKITAEEGKEIFQLKCDIKLTNAESVEKIVKSCNAVQYLILRLLKDNNEERNRVLDLLKEMEAYWSRVNQIEKVLNKSFTPVKINDSLEDQINAEKVYFLLVKNFPIRTNLKNEITITATYNNEFKKEQVKTGSHLATSQVKEETYVVYEEKIKVYKIVCIFNAIINSVEINDEKQECIIKCKGTETKPIYNVSLGFKSEEEIPSNKEFNRIYKEISNAKTFEELMDEL